MYITFFSSPGKHRLCSRCSDCFLATLTVTHNQQLEMQFFTLHMHIDRWSEDFDSDWKALLMKDTIFMTIIITIIKYTL